MREMKDSGIDWIGNIPTEWDVVSFRVYLDDVPNSIVDGPFGSDLKNEEYVDEGVPVIQLGSIREYRMDFSKMHYVTEEKADTLKRHNAFPSNIAIAKMMPAGKACEIPDLYDRYVVSADVIKATISNPSVRKYVIYALNSCATVQAEIESQGSTRSRVNIDKVKHFKIPMPPKEMFISISTFLDVKCSEIDALSADIQSEIDILQEYKQSVITEAVTKGLDKNVPMKDSGTDWLGSIPKHWSISRIGSVYNVRVTKVSDRDYEPLSVTMKGVVPQLENAAKTNAHDDRKLVRKGDFVINSRSDRKGSCGISPFNGSVSLINTVLAPMDEMNPEYYNWLFHTVEFADEFYKWGHGIVDDLWTTGWQEMKRILIPFPTLNEQKEIANYLNLKCSGIDDIITQKREQLEALSGYKKSIIYEYVTGKKEVPNG